MSSFHDGPADGQILFHKHAPLVLRVVRSTRSGKFDVCDQLVDKPASDEDVFLYVCCTGIARVHIKAAKRSESGFYEHGTYVFWKDGTPACRHNETWVKWVDERREEILAFRAEHKERFKPAEAPLFKVPPTSESSSQKA